MAGVIASIQHREWFVFFFFFFIERNDLSSVWKIQYVHRRYAVPRARVKYFRRLPTGFNKKKKCIFSSSVPEPFHAKTPTAGAARVNVTAFLAGNRPDASSSTGDVTRRAVSIGVGRPRAYNIHIIDNVIVRERRRPDAAERAGDRGAVWRTDPAASSPCLRHAVQT